jgi:hypothetical protein
MNIEALYELKKQYEIDLIRAEAKVAVITDIIATQERTAEEEQNDIAETEVESPIQNY